MKKTLITLLALAGVACAAQQPLTLATPSGGSLTSSNAYVTWSEDIASLESWAVSFVLDVTRDALSAQDLATIPANTMFAINSDGTVEFYNGVTSSVNSTDIFVSSVEETPTITLTYIADVKDGNVIGGTLSATSGSNKLEIYVKDTDDIDMSLTKNNFRLWTNGGLEHFSGISVAKLDSNLVPEPATATLSLLALAGLAMRRRRK